MIYGFGLIKGLFVTAKRLLSKKVTEKYPDVLPDLPERSHGSFAFDADRCITCGLCANTCPNGVIRLDLFKDEKGRNILKNFQMSLGYCMFCGQCVDICPRQAIYFKPDFNLTCFNRQDTIHTFRGNKYPPAAAQAAPQEKEAKA